MGELEPQSRAGKVALRKPPIPVLEGVRLFGEECGTQVLAPLVPLRTEQPYVIEVPQEQR